MEKLTDEELLRASGGLPQNYTDVMADKVSCEQYMDKSNCVEKGCTWDKDHLTCITK